MSTTHHINIQLPGGEVKVMDLRGNAIPRVGDRMKLHFTHQKIDGVFEVTAVQWQVTNAGTGTRKFTSEAQGEIWVKPYDKPPPKWFMALGNLVFTVAVLAATLGGAWYLLRSMGVSP